MIAIVIRLFSNLYSAASKAIWNDRIEQNGLVE
jgi:hypothetical protein